MWKNRAIDFIRNHDFSNDNEWLETERIKKIVAEHTDKNPGKGLNIEVLEEILRWKLRRQYGRQIHIRKSLENDVVSAVTACALNITHSDPGALDKVRLNLLMSLPGISCGVGSGILCLVYPERYGVIDFRVWDEIKETSIGKQPVRRNFNFSHYQMYLSEIRSFSNEIGATVQEIDFTLWRMWDIRRG
jgi:hypothetical protein